MRDTARFATLADDETGVSCGSDLKPVWLMSPLSVSDTLPLAVDAFDVAIFGRQPLSLSRGGGVPAVFRAPQVIVVGDEMQLPPTNFFSPRRPTRTRSLTAREASRRRRSRDAGQFPHAVRAHPPRRCSLALTAAV
jgi:hypothetical protein